MSSAASRSIAAALAACALVAAVCRGQTPIELPPNAAGDPVIRGEVEAVEGSHRPGGYGYAIVALRNHATDARAVALSLERSGYGPLDFSCRRRVELAPGEAVRVVLPLPTGRGQIARLTAEASGVRDPWSNMFQGASSRAGPAVLCLTDDSDRALAWQQLIDRAIDVFSPLRKGTRRPKTRLAAWHVQPADVLPDRWQWLTGFDVIILDGGIRGLDGEAQRLLRDFVVGGGNLIVHVPSALGAGPLESMLASETDVLGRWLPVDDPTLRSTAESTVRTWLAPVITASFDNGYDAAAGPVPQQLHLALAIPGLGEVPMRWFFVFILLFAIVVGPINHFVAYRKRKPLIMLLTVPALGIGCTVFFLLFGLLSEGLGIKGVIRSYTVLDQREHRATSLSTRTLYAGLSPSELAPDAGTYLYSPDSYDTAGRWPAPSHVDLDSGRVDGSALPSRNPTTFLAVSQGPCRERLRFRRREGGDLEVLAGPAFLPLAVFLMDHDERLYRSQADGTMVPLDHLDLPALREELAMRFDLSTAPREIPWRGFVTQPPTSAPGSSPLLPVSLSLEPGTYLALARDMPAVDDLDLTVHYLTSVHVVKGVLAAEDFVE